MTSKISPVSVLAEMMMSKNAPPPQYLFCEDADGKFVCTILVDGKSASAISTSKRLAKRESARIVLQKLLMSHHSFSQSTSSSDQTQTALKNHVEKIMNEYSLKQDTISKKDSKKGPTSVLHELMISKKEPQPQYLYFEESGGKIKCTVLMADGTSASAVSTSKKLAKRESSRILLQKLMPQESSQLTSTQKQTKLKAPTKQTQVTSKNPIESLNDCSSKQNLMDSKQSPDSVLNELMISKKKPHPQYSYFEESNGKIKCIVLAEGKTASAVSTTKKLAKREGARIMLQKLMPQKSSQPTSTQKQAKLKDSTKQPQTASKNFIGELNEFSSKHKSPNPVYEFWPVTTSIDGDVFIVSCTFMEHQALGKGKSKKEAKQNSARNMLELYLKEVKSEPSSSKAKTKTTKTGKASNCGNQKCETNVGKNAVAAKYLEGVISQISTLSMNKQTKKDGQEPSPIQIVINLPN